MLTKLLLVMIFTLLSLGNARMVGQCETSRRLVGSSTDGVQGVVAVGEAVGRGEDVAGVEQHPSALAVAPVCQHSVKHLSSSLSRLELQTIHRCSQSRRRAILGPSPG